MAASCSGTSSGSGAGTAMATATVEEERKRRRMQSNRESARRSRMRKQKYLDELVAQVGELHKEKSQVLTALNVTTQHYITVEAENQVLRTQMLELSSRLQSLHEILLCMNMNVSMMSSNSSSFDAGSNGVGFLCEEESIWSMVF